MGTGSAERGSSGRATLLRRHSRLRSLESRSARIRDECARRDDHLHCLFPGHLQIHDALLGDEKQESRGRIHGARDENALERPARLRARFARGPGRYETEPPGAGRRELDDRDPAEAAGPAGAQEELRDLPQRRVDLVDEGDPVHDAVPQTEEPLPEKVGREKAEQEEQTVQEDEAETEHGNAARAELAPENSVEEIEEAPDYPRGQSGGSEDEEAGDPIPPQARPERVGHGGSLALSSQLSAVSHAGYECGRDRAKMAERTG